MFEKLYNYIMHSCNEDDLLEENHLIDTKKNAESLDRDLNKYQTDNISLKERWNLNEEHFGDLLPYIKDDNVTDIDWDSDSLWIKYTNGKREKINNVNVTKDFVKRFTDRVANHENLPFNKMSRSFSSETDTLRITCVEESLAVSGRSFSIRKTLPRLRFTPGQAIHEKYCDKELMCLLANCIESHCNIVFCGNPGAGKTESAKFFSSNFIPNDDKVITVEDTREWRYKEINPQKNGIELIAKTKDDYVEAIKTALRLNPDWLMVSEARSREIVYVLEGLSIGVGTITTLHTDDVRKIPNRILNMKGESVSPQTDLNDIYSFIQVGVLIKEVKTKDNFYKREINQVCFFEHDYKTNENKVHMVYQNGSLIKENIPYDLKKKILENTLSSDIFNNSNVERMLNTPTEQQYATSEKIGKEVAKIKKGE